MTSDLNDRRWTLVLDQGGHATRALIFDENGNTAAELEVEFAYPTQTLFLERAHSAPPPPAPASSAEVAARNEGLAAVQNITKTAPWRNAIPSPVVIIGDPTFEKSRGSQGQAGDGGGSGA